MRAAIRRLAGPLALLLAWPVSLWAAPALAAGSITTTARTLTTLTLREATPTGGTAPYTYQWYRSTASGFTPDGSSLLAGQTAITLSDTGLSRLTAYYYKVVVTDSVAATATSAEKTKAALTLNLVCDGDSLTSGFGASAEHDFPTLMLDLLPSAAITNQGHSADTMNHLVNFAATDVDPLLVAGMQNALVVWAGTNDLWGNTSADATYALGVTYVQARQAVGWKVIFIDMLPRTISGGSSLPAVQQTNFQIRRASFNTSVLTAHVWLAEGFLSVASDANIGADGQQTNATYYTDQIHLNDFGDAYLAPLVVGAVSAALATPAIHMSLRIH